MLKRCLFVFSYHSLSLINVLTDTKQEQSFEKKVQICCKLN